MSLDTPWELDEFAHAFVRRTRGEASFGEIAKCLGCTEDTVHDIFRGAMEKLQRSEGVAFHTDYGPRVVDEPEDKSVQLSDDELHPLREGGARMREVASLTGSPLSARINEALCGIERRVVYAHEVLALAEGTASCSSAS